MKKILISCCIALLLAGCSHLQRLSGSSPDTNPSVAETQTEAVASDNDTESESNAASENDDWPTVAQLLERQQALCRLPQPQLNQRLDKLPAVKTQTEQTAEPRSRQLDRWLLLSCFWPEKLEASMRSLKTLQSHSDWPLGYQAYFDWMEKQMQQYLKLQQEKQAVEERMRKTIEELTEIEQAIDAR